MSTIKTIGSDLDKKDLKERADNMAKELEVLSKKNELLISSRPVITQDGRLSSEPLFISSRKPEEKKTLSE